MGRAGHLSGGRSEGGLVSCRKGQSAEDAVARRYRDCGRTIAATRWRGPSGEIDLIVRDGAEVIFVEVKAAASHAEAAERLSRHQMDRICQSAAAFLAGEPAGQLTAIRFDVALVDRVGRIEIVENAFAA